MKAKLTLAAIALALVAGCSPKLYMPGAKNAEIAKGKGMSTSLDDLKKGREIYLANCGKCHGLYQPSAYTDQRWPKILDFMAPKAKIDQEQRDLVQAYLLSYSK